MVLSKASSPNVTTSEMAILCEGRYASNDEYPLHRGSCRSQLPLTHDAHIAEVAHISNRTAENHVQHILTKMGFRNRSQIAVWVTQRAHPPAGEAVP